jgi:hypothetical protein
MLLLLLFLASAQASETRSQVRFPGEDFRHAARRYLGERSEFPAGSAQDAAVSIDQLDVSLATSWDSLGTMAAFTQAFEQVRDARYMYTKDQPGFARRISWLYPDDGCFDRSALAVQKLAELHYPAPTKIFIFGNLGVKTPNSPWGGVGWWFHVVPIVSFQGKTYVLDQAVEPKRPLLLSEWVALVSDDPSAVTASICVSSAYMPDTDCAVGKDDGDALKDEQGYLKKEWKRQIRLKRDPTQVLGDAPPWGS